MQWEADVSTPAFFLQIEASFQPQSTVKVFHVPGRIPINLKKCQNRVLAQENAEVERKPIGWFKESQRTKLHVMFSIPYTKLFMKT